MNRKPKCIIVTGRPGSGKTTLAKKLGEHLWLPVISRDEIKEGYVSTHGVKHNQLPETTNTLVSDLFFEIVNHYLANRISVIIEAAFQHNVWESRIQRIVEVSLPLIVICEVDDVVAANRHLKRGIENPEREFYHGDNRVAHYRKTGEILPPETYRVPDLKHPSIRVSTDGAYLQPLDEIVKQIKSKIFIKSL